MAVNDDITRSLTGHLVDLDQFDDRIIRQVLKILEDAEAEILERLRVIDPSSPTAQTYRQARLSRLLEQVRGTMATAYDGVIDATHTGLREVGQMELEFGNSELAQALAPVRRFAEFNTVAVGPELLRRLAEDTIVDLGGIDGAAVVADWFRAQEVQTIAAVAQQLQQGVYQGEAIGEMIRRIAGGGRHTGVLQVGRNWARTLVRTSVTAIVNQARGDIFAANRETIRGVYQVSHLDERTTLVCIVYAGRGWVYDDAGVLVPEGHSLPFNGGTPRHPSCRSTINPWVRSFEEMGIGADELPKSLRDRFSGKIPAGLDGESKLRKASESLQGTVMGKGIAQLWRSGAVSLDQLVDRNGQPLTLKAARELVG